MPSNTPADERVETMKLMYVHSTRNLPKATGGSDPDIGIRKDVMVAQLGPGGTIADIQSESAFGTIATYVVREGDTLGHISELFGVSAQTIRWVNDLGAKGVIRPGQILRILPLDGVEHTIEKGDTLAAIAKKYEGDVIEIKDFNSISSDSELVVGTTIVVPGGSLPPPPPPVVVAPKPSTSGSSRPTTKTTRTSGGYYTHPLAGQGIRTQRCHGRFNAVDFGTPIGTAIVASAPGRVVVVSSPDRWGGGYGGYIVIEHDNGTQTLYAHNSRNTVSLGQFVGRGDRIAESGNSGRSTGPHLHFEIRDKSNRFSACTEF